MIHFTLLQSSKALNAKIPSRRVISKGWMKWNMLTRCMWLGCGFENHVDLLGQWRRLHRDNANRHRQSSELLSCILGAPRPPLIQSSLFTAVQVASLNGLFHGQIECLSNMANTKATERQIFNWSTLCGLFGENKPSFLKCISVLSWPKHRLVLFVQFLHFTEHLKCISYLMSFFKYFSTFQLLPLTHTNNTKLRKKEKTLWHLFEKGKCDGHLLSFST